MRLALRLWRETPNNTTYSTRDVEAMPLHNKLSIQRKTLRTYGWTTHEIPSITSYRKPLHDKARRESLWVMMARSQKSGIVLSMTFSLSFESVRLKNYCDTSVTNTPTSTSPSNAKKIRSCRSWTCELTTTRSYSCSMSFLNQHTQAAIGSSLHTIRTAQCEQPSQDSTNG